MACPNCGSGFFSASDNDLEDLLSGLPAMVTCANDMCKHEYLNPGFEQPKAGDVEPSQRERFGAD